MVKQLTLDIEHYLGEAVKTTAEWGHRYLAFTDYNVQVVEVHHFFFLAHIINP